MQTDRLWTFKTKNFAVAWEVEPCFDLDLSFDDTGEVAEKLQSGEYVAFDSAIRVLYRGEEIAADYLGQSIYENPEDFRDHIGRNPIALANRAKQGLARAKADFAKRMAYAQEKRISGDWTHSHYIRSTECARTKARAARIEYLRAMRMAARGGYGSYFSDMVRTAISEARAHMSDRPYMRKIAA